MTFGPLFGRIVPAAFMAAGAALLAWRGRARSRAIAWGALGVLALVYALALNLQPNNFPHSNFDHYYLGAKYPAPYTDTYRLIRAGEGEPQLAMRDLERPDHLVRETPAEQRAYLIDLLRRSGVEFDPLAPLDSLLGRARASGVIEAEARRILAADLPAGRIPAYRRDVRAALAAGQGPHITLDYGYNGSPFYGLLRRLDPTLHLPFGRGVAALGLVGQLAGLALVALLIRLALGLTGLETLAVMVLMLAGADFATFVMPGLVFTVVWAPLLVAAWALARRQFALAGTAIACAGLVKLFPFALLAVAAVPLARSLLTRNADGRRSAVTLLGTCVAATAALGALSLTSGRTWIEFAHKLHTEFQSSFEMINSVSVAAALATLGVPHGSPLYTLVALVALVPLAALYWKPAADHGASVAARALVFTAGLAWVVKSWLNYYAVLPLALLPWLARRQRTPAAAIALGMGLAFLLPDFDDPALMRDPMLHVAKLVPYLAAPAWLVWLELRPARWSPRAVRLAAVTVVVLGVATAVEAWRGHAIADETANADAALANGDAAAALVHYDRLLHLSPGDARAERRRAVALATMGRIDDAVTGFAHVVAGNPKDAAARDDYGRALLLADRPGEAAAQLEQARALTPDDVQILYELARVSASQGDTTRARGLLARARELAPDEPAITTALAGLGAR